MLKKIINTAKGANKADLVIKNANLVNVLSEEIYKTDIAITDGIIVGLGDDYCGEYELDVKGAYITPSFIDAHVHLESSMMLPKEFAKAVLKCGTTTVIADPHEIANVLGLSGIEFMMEATKNLDLDVFFMLPSCVPATDFETSGFSLSANDLEKLIDKPSILGLAEMMNYVGVINNNDNVLAKIELAKKYNKCIDGHAPLLSGKDLCAYVASGVKSDHECTTPEEALEKLRLGLNIMIREGSAAKDLKPLIPFLKKYCTRKCMFATDDRHPTQLNEHINGMVKECVAEGIDVIKAVQCASLNGAEYFGLKDRGAVAPGYKADMLVFENLRDFNPRYVIKNGKIIVENGKLVNHTSDINNSNYTNSMHVAPFSVKDFTIPAKSRQMKIIEVKDHQLLTKEKIADVKLKENCAISDIDNDILKICVMERHHYTHNIARGFVRGFGLKNGAIASTVAHDSHNMIIIGTNDEDMYFAAQELSKMGGGKIVIQNGKIKAALPLPVAGLISDSSFEELKILCESLKKEVANLGCSLDDPFMTMAFLSLSVIPELKITDKGLFSTQNFNFTDLFVE